ncbi:hypothetical protein DFJ74DRAFT_663378, partial [Hyaloraphidium curvatum]
MSRHRRPLLLLILLASLTGWIWHGRDDMSPPRGRVYRAALSNPFLKCALEIFDRPSRDKVFVPLFPDQGRGQAPAFPEAIYVAHYSPLKQRRDYLRTILAGIQPAPELVVGFDREALTAHDRRCLAPGPNSTDGRLGAIPPRDTWYELAAGEVSLGAKHYAIYWDILQRGLKNALILEDDVAVDPELKAFVAADFRAALTSMVRAGSWLPSNYSLFFPGSCFNVHGPEPAPGKPPIGASLNVILDLYNVSLSNPRVFRAFKARCTHAYVVSRSGALDMISRLPLSLPIDHMMDDQTKDYNWRQGQGHGLGIWWMEPPVLSQAADTELVGHSSIRDGVTREG